MKKYIIVIITLIIGIFSSNLAFAFEQKGEINYISMIGKNQVIFYDGYGPRLDNTLFVDINGKSYNFHKASFDKEGNPINVVTKTDTGVLLNGNPVNIEAGSILEEIMLLESGDVLFSSYIKKEGDRPYFVYINGVNIFSGTQSELQKNIVGGNVILKGKKYIGVGNERLYFKDIDLTTNVYTYSISCENGEKFIYENNKKVPYTIPQILTKRRDVPQDMVKTKVRLGSNNLFLNEKKYLFSDNGTIYIEGCSKESNEFQVSFIYKDVDEKIKLPVGIPKNITENTPVSTAQSVIPVSPEVGSLPLPEKQEVIIQKAMQMVNKKGENVRKALLFQLQTMKSKIGENKREIYNRIIYLLSNSVKL